VKEISKEVVIGVDLGGSAIRLGVINDHGRLSGFKSIEIPQSRKKEIVLTLITDSIREHIQNQISIGNKVLAVGIGSPGIINPDKGLVVTSPNFPGWRNVPLKSLLEKSFNLPVFLDNDANSAAFGEKWRGAGRRVNSLVCLTMGTGIGGGIILNGEVWRGAHGMSGEIGHITVNPEGPKCNCGNYGCLESYSSATGMVRSAIGSIKKGTRTILLRLTTGEIKKIDAKLIHEAAIKGDRLSLNILKEAGMYLGIAIANLMNILNPDMIVLTGAVTGSWDFFMPAAMEEVERRALKTIVGRTRIVKGKLSGTAGVIGAAGIAWRQLGHI